MVSTCMLGHTYSASVGPSEALIRCNQRSLRSSEVIRGHQRSSVVIRGHQRHSSEPIKERERERESPSTGPLGGAPGRSKHAQVVVKVVVKA